LQGTGQAAGWCGNGIDMAFGAGMMVPHLFFSFLSTGICIGGALSGYNCWGALNYIKKTNDLFGCFNLVGIRISLRTRLFGLKFNILSFFRSLEIVLFSQQTVLFSRNKSTYASA
jgi:hypothetical protein